MEAKKCIKPNCGLVFNENDEEFKQGYCECGCILKLLVEEIDEVAVDIIEDKKIHKTSEVIGISEDGTLIFTDDNIKVMEPKFKAKYLEVYFNGQVYKTFLIKYDEVIIGRASTDGIPDLDLSGIDLQKKVSRRHAMIYRIQNEYYIKNLSMKNSLHVNGVPVTFNNVIKIEPDSEIVLSNFIGLYFNEEELESDSYE